MNKAWVAGLAMVGLVGPMGVSASPAEPSLCTQLAETARRAQPSTWLAPDPMAAWLKPAGHAAASPILTALVNDARWQEKLGPPVGVGFGVQRLQGTSVYLVETFQGTAICQGHVLVEAKPRQPARQLDPPFSLDGLTLCTTQFAQFAQVLGQPAYVVGGAPSMTSPELQYRIARWTGKGWGQACSVALRRQTALKFAQRFCAPGHPVCDSGQPVAERLAQAYEASHASNTTLDDDAFFGGRTPDAGTIAALNPPLNAPGAIGELNPPFPLFGADDKRLDAMLTVFSNADPRRLPVFIDGRWWLAIVGRSGVGWREGGAVLVALFAPPGAAGDGVASYQFKVVPAGLRDAVATDKVR